MNTLKLRVTTDQLNQLDLLHTHPSDCHPLLEAAQELLLRQAEHGKDYSSAIFILLEALKNTQSTANH